MPVNPFDFPKLPVRTNPTSAVSSSSSKQNRKASFKTVKTKESADTGNDDNDGGLFGGFGMGLFDGAADEPSGLDGQWDSQGSRPNWLDYPRLQRSARTPNYRGHRYEDVDPWATGSTDEDRRRHVRFQLSPLSTHTSSQSSERHRSPSGSQRYRHESDEIHPHLLRRRRGSPEQGLTRERHEERYADPKHSHTDRDRRRRGGPEDARYLVDGHEELARERRRIENSARRHSGNRSPVRGRGRSKSSDRLEEDVNRSDPKLYAAVANVIQAVQQGPSKGSEGRRRRHPSPSECSVRSPLVFL
jgi:hypothetical protein